MPAAPADRAERLAVAVEAAGLDGLIVGDLVRPGDSGREAMADVIWLTGFSGSSGLALVGPATVASSSPTSATPSASATSCPPASSWSRPSVT